MSKIINIGSVAGIKVIEHEHSHAGSYGPSKALMHALTKDWAVFLAHRHITVNAIAPGLFPSGMLNDPEFIQQAASWNRLGNVRSRIYDWFARPLVVTGALQRCT